MYNYDIFSQICKHLKDKEKINLSAATTVTNDFKYRLIYVDQISWKKIHKLSFYDNFESIIIDTCHYRFSKNAKNVTICCYPNCIICTMSPDFEIPATVTHLTLHQDVRYPSPIIIPSGYIQYFAQHLKTKIPGSVTHLTFSGFFNERINDYIPNSVTHLRFGECFNQSLENDIPNSVTHLSFDYDYNFDTPLPASVTHLKIGMDGRYILKTYGEELKNYDTIYVRNNRKYISSVKEFVHIF
uniref:F-box and FNIP repeat-containing protein n=1 Tax=viral metagenome TaxID=1070528 RepID=A0A6C0C7F0_9ZZZZ